MNYQTIIELLLPPKLIQPTTLETPTTQPSTTQLSAYTTQLPDGEVNNNSSSYTPDNLSSSNVTDHTLSPTTSLPSVAVNSHTNLLPLTIVTLMLILIL